MSIYNFWETDLTYLKKVGPKRAELLLKECGLRNFGDLLEYFPFKYVDKSKLHKVRDITSASSQVTLMGKINEIEMLKPGKGHERLVATFSDGSGEIELIWYQGAKWIEKSLKIGEEYILFGAPKIFSGKISISHPELELRKDPDDAMKSLKIVPYYPGTDALKRAGLDSRGFRTIIEQMLERGKIEIHENLSPFVVGHYKLMSHAAAMVNIHFPESFEALEEARKRIKFEEFFFFQLQLAKKKIVEQPRHKSFPFPKVGNLFNEFYEKHLPFSLTLAQKRVIKEIRKDLAQPIQMNRLIQGDVGSGKTIVAFLTMLIALDNGFQTAIMAPTEILALQHFRNISGWCREIGVKVGLFTGSQRKSERTPNLSGLLSGEISIAVGTHALIEDPVKFKSLGLVVIDEQHKFGVLQRARLWQKSEKFPHNMLMTATPIPRTLALTLYGDVDVSVIDELPPGRTPVITAIRLEPQRKMMLGFVTDELMKGRQAYFVYPLVEESDKVDWLAVTEGYESLTRYFGEKKFHVDLVHGRMKPEDKEKTMQRFKNGLVHVLVATTVIEVGVDVPNASIMVIENSEKFGLSQLHQLRGRVGRGGEQSFCILMVGAKSSEDAKKRLKAMASTHDGFKIAEYDLRLRGPGDFLGTRQSGMPEFKLADIIEDSNVLLIAREAAFNLMEADPEMESSDNLATKKAFNGYLKRQQGLGGLA